MHQYMASGSARGGTSLPRLLVFDTTIALPYGRSRDTNVRDTRFRHEGWHWAALLCVFPRYAPSFGSFEFSYPLTDGVRAFMPPQGLLVIAAAVPAGLAGPLHRREHRRQPRDDDFAWAEVVFVSGMHVQRRADGGHPAPRPRARPRRSCWAARRCPPARSIIRTSTICTSANWATPPTICSHGSSATPSRPPRQVVLDHARAPRADRVSAPGLRAGAAAALFHRQHPVLQRLPVPVRVLRHPGALRPQSALQDRRADQRRARQDAGLRAFRRGLFRRRQLHRPQPRRARAAAASRRVAEAQPLSVARSPARRR